MSKVCSKCGQRKELGAFWNSGRGGLQSWCKSCKLTHAAEKAGTIGIGRCEMSAAIRGHNFAKRGKQNTIVKYGAEIVEVLDSHIDDWEEREFAAGLAGRGDE